MKTKIKFSDIAEMLERDEMKEIVGGSGYTYSGGSGGGSNFVSGTALGGGGSSFGGANFNYSGGGMGGGLSSNYGPSNSSYGSNSYGSGTSSSSVNQSAYDYYASLYGVGPKTAQNSATYGVYNPNGVNLNSGSYYGGYNPEDGVIIIKNPKTYAPVSGSSVDLNNLFNPNMNYNPNTGSFMPVTGSTNTLDNQQRKQQMDCVFQCLGWISAMYGDSSHNSKYYEQMYALSNPNLTTNALYNSLTGSGGGVPQNQVLNFTSKFFNATDYSGASSQFLAKYINPSTNPNGNNQLIGIYRNQTTNGLHAVAVTSIEGNKVYFYDPQNGNPGSVNLSEMNSFIGITGK